MTVETLTPSSRAEWLSLRKSTIGASEVAALLNAHPWLTPYQLWAMKSGLAPPVEETPAMRRGRLLEAVAIDFLREERPEWSVKANPIPGGRFYRDLGAGLSATPDAFVSRPADGVGFWVCQIKSVEPYTFKRTWIPDDNGNPVPPYVAIQAIQEATLTGASWACVGALVVGHGIDLHLIDIDLHAGLMASIRTKAAEFWRRVRENDPPPVDYARDGDVIRGLYDEDDGGEIDLSGNERVHALLHQRQLKKDVETEATLCTKERKTIDAELIHLLGNAARGTLADGRVIEAKTVRKKGFTVDPTTYRSIKIKQRKVA